MECLGEVLAVFATMVFVGYIVYRFSKSKNKGGGSGGKTPDNTQLK